MQQLIRSSFEQSDGVAQLKYRAYIDGLRALAVLSVVGFHAFPDWVQGGFVGVDVFFVISGYLISSIIFRDLQGHLFSFADFYARRIRRIFPALIIVMTACYVFGWFALFPDEYRQLGKHLLGGAGFYSNFVFWSEAGYFDNSAETKPLLHLWSLGIEEQFYLIWPLLLVMAKKYKLNFLVITLLIILVSFTFNVFEIHKDATASFYSPVSRLWELSIGSALAYIKLEKDKSYQRISLQFDRVIGWMIWRKSESQVNSRSLGSDAQAITGLALVGLSVFLLNKTDLFPGWWALFPTLGAGLILSADSSSWINGVVLSNPILVWLGAISYPLYLWHWPILAYAQIIESGVLSPGIRMTAILIAFLLAWLTYVLIEKPIRFGKHGAIKVIVLCLLMIILGLIGYITYDRGGLAFRSISKSSLQQQQSFIWNEYDSTQFACIKQHPLGGRYCLQAFLDKPVTVALIGDSHANHLYVGFSEYYKKKGENLLNLGERLPYWNLETGPNGTQDTFVFYKNVMNNILNYVIETPSIKTIILASAGVVYVTESNYHLKLLSHSLILKHEDIFALAMRETLEKMVKTGKQIIFVIDTPELGFDPKSCLHNRPFRLMDTVRSPCAIEKKAFNSRTEIYYAVIKKVLKDFPSVKVFSPSKYLCDEKYCWAIREGEMLFRDENHLSHKGSLFIGSQYGMEQEKYN